MIAVSSPPAAAEVAPPLTVVTFNIFHGGAGSGLIGDAAQLDRRLEMAAAELEALRPDVVGLQEVPVSWGRGNVAERLARRLGLHWAHAPAISRLIPLLGPALTLFMNFDEGPAVLSRFPVLARTIHDLPRCQSRFDARVLLGVTLATPRGSLQVFSTHTSRDDCQVRRVGELVRERRGRLPSIVMGDFNTAESLPAMAELRQQARFVDVFRAANPGAPGFTVWQRVHAPSATVFRRVDYVFLVPGDVVPGRVLESRVVLETPGRGANGATLWPSDHYGVLARLDVFE